MQSLNQRSRRARRRAPSTHVASRPSFVEHLEDRTLFSTYIVTTGGDGAATVAPVLKGVYTANTLRAAINAANAAPGADLIVINPFLSGQITLDASKGELAITDSVYVQGFGANRQSINGAGVQRVFSVAAGVNATISDMAISNGLSVGRAGAGIRNAGTLTLERVNVTGNTAVDADGAGVYNAGTVVVRDSTFSNNKATLTGSGGALFNVGKATIVNSTFANNSGFFGGALYNASGSTMVVNNSTISGNHANYAGGGIAGSLTDPDTMPSGTLLNNTIVAGNTYTPTATPIAPDSPPLGPDLYGFFDPKGSGNLIGNLGFAKGMDPAKNKLGSIADATPAIDAKLSVLGYYGGTTMTMPPKAGSLAINGGDNTVVPAGLFNDQRGGLRIKSGKVDIGAVEV